MGKIDVLRLSRPIETSFLPWAIKTRTAFVCNWEVVVLLSISNGKAVVFWLQTYDGKIVTQVVQITLLLGNRVDKKEIEGVTFFEVQADDIVGNDIVWNCFCSIYGIFYFCFVVIKMYKRIICIRKGEYESNIKNRIIGRTYY